MLRPRISTNLAISADGKISSSARIPAGWTSTEDKRRLSELRTGTQAIMVGRGTFENDRMTMTAPGDPLRCIVSHSGKIDPAHPIFSKPGGSIHLLVTGGGNPDVPSGVTVHHSTLAEFLHRLATEHQIERLHCEGGGELIHALAEMDAIDEFHLTLAGHTLFGGEKSPTPTGVPEKFLPATCGFTLSHFEPLPEKGECFLSYIRKQSAR